MKTQHRLTLSTNELIVIREALHSITIKGVDSIVVAGALEKVYKGIDKARVDEEETQPTPTTPKK